MVKTKFVSILSLLLFPVFSLGASAWAQSDSRPPARAGELLYHVMPKDHLAEILRSMGFQDLWSKRGMVARTIKANDGTLKDPNALETGSWIYIPAVKLPSASGFEIADGEIVRRHGANSAANEVSPAEKSEAPAAAPPGREPLPAHEQSVQVQCPDHSVREARVQLVLPKPPSHTPLLIVLDKDGICAPDSSSVAAAPPTPERAAPVTAPAAKAQEPPMSATPAPAAASTKLEELRPATDATTPASRDLSQLPFVISPIVSYIGDTFQFGGVMGSPNAGGIGYGARLGYVYRHADWGYLVDLAYRQGQLSTTDSTGDYVTMSMLEYGLGVSYRHWTLRAGFANNSLTDTSSNGSVGFADKGYYGSLAYSFFFSARSSCSLEGRYTGITYQKSNNSGLANDAPSTQLEAMLSYDYRFALW